MAMNQQSFRRSLRVLVLAVGTQLFCNLQLYAQPVDLDAAAAAKAKAGVDALNRAPTDVPHAVGTFVTFDVPGAVNGTNPTSINRHGAITGYYNDANFVGHGFLRTRGEHDEQTAGREGALITFDVPGAVNGTYPASINSAGAITGSYVDANFLGHGFLRAKDGTLSTFDVPGAVLIGTAPSSINSAGEITGSYYEASFVGHGFLRAANGTLVTFDAPSAGTTGDFPGTYAVSINREGAIVGMYTDTKSVPHGFVRASDGTFTTFDPPGRIANFAPFAFAQTLYINAEGVITGAYFESILGNPFGGIYRVFVRTRSGSFITFDAATYPPCCIWSFPTGITVGGAITGSFNDGHTINHGFLRDRDGTVITFDAPGAGTGFNQGTVPLGITSEGVIMGLYIDAKRVSHGFVLLPFEDIIGKGHGGN
jgi:hypothetical protein